MPTIILSDSGLQRILFKKGMSYYYDSEFVDQDLEQDLGRFNTLKSASIPLEGQNLTNSDPQGANMTRQGRLTGSPGPNGPRTGSITGNGRVPGEATVPQRPERRRRSVTSPPYHAQQVGNPDTQQGTNKTLFPTAPNQGGEVKELKATIFTMQHKIQVACPVFLPCALCLLK